MSAKTNKQVKSTTNIAVAPTPKRKQVSKKKTAKRKTPARKQAKRKTPAKATKPKVTGIAERLKALGIDKPLTTRIGRKGKRMHSARVAAFIVCAIALNDKLTAALRKEGWSEKALPNAVKTWGKSDPTSCCSVVLPSYKTFAAMFKGKGNGKAIAMFRKLEGVFKDSGFHMQSIIAYKSGSIRPGAYSDDTTELARPKKKKVAKKRTTTKK